MDILQVYVSQLVARNYDLGLAIYDFISQSVNRKSKILFRLVRIRSRYLFSLFTQRILI